MGTLREERLRRTREALTDTDFDALLLWKNENVRFASALRVQIIQDKSALLNSCLVTKDQLIMFLYGGAREYDVVAAAMHALYGFGGEMRHLMTPFVAPGDHMSPPNRFATDKVIREGDLVFNDIGAMWNIFTALYHALAAGTTAMKVGNANLDIGDATFTAGDRYGLGTSFLSLSAATVWGLAPMNLPIQVNRYRGPVVSLEVEIDDGDRVIDLGSRSAGRSCCTTGRHRCGWQK